MRGRVWICVAVDGWKGRRIASLCVYMLVSLPLFS